MVPPVGPPHLVNAVSPFVPPRFCPLPPTGGAIGPEPSHFVVEEIPAYPLSGEGEHLFLHVEKRGRNTIDVVKAIARASGIKDRDIGYAGMKDKNAITRQWFSLCTKEEDPASWDLGDGIRLLSSTRHGNKLRTGHLIGNRFTITLVDPLPGGRESAQNIAEFLQENGLPNYFGPQRFGYQGKNLTQALSWLNGSLGTKEEQQEERPSRARRGKKSRFDNKLLPSVIQSELFNRYVATRLQTAEKLLDGEVVRLDGTGKSFVVEDVEKEQPRYDAGDLHLTGPMIGPKGLQAERDARKLELSIAEELGLTSDHLSALGKSAPGTRRDVLLEIEGLTLEDGPSGSLVLSFSLPAGAYATGVLREFTGAEYLEPRAQTAPSDVK